MQYQMFSSFGREEIIVVSARRALTFRAG